MTYDDFLLLVIVPLSWVVFYEAGKRKLLNDVRKRLVEFFENAANSHAEKSAGLPEDAKQALLDSFMKGADK